MTSQKDSQRQEKNKEKENTKQSFFRRFRRLFLAGGIALTIGITAVFMAPTPRILATENFFAMRNVSKNGHFEIAFSAAMNKSSVEKSVRLSPPIAGDFSWKNSETLIFSPKENLRNGDTITLFVDAGAKNILGKSIGGTVEIQYLIVGIPEVTMISPITPEEWENILSARTKNTGKKIPENIALLKKGQKITILFDRPMRALGEEKDISEWVKFSPELTGSWRWIGTSAVELSPDEIEFPMAQEISAKILPGIGAIDGGKTTEEITWKMRTPSPAIEKVLVGDREVLLGGRSNTDFPRNEDIFIEWNQPVELESFFKHLVITPERKVKDDIISLDETNSNRIRIHFSPPLEAGANVRISIQKGVAPAKGKFASESDFSTQFQTIRAGCFQLTKRAILPNTPAYIDFCAPIKDEKMRSQFLKENLEISPKPEDFSVNCNYYSGCAISFAKKVGETYSFRLKSDLTDDFGQLIPREKISFSVNKFPPSFSIMTRNFSNTSVFDGSEPFGLFASVRDISEVKIAACGVSLSDFRQHQNDWSVDPSQLCGDDIVKWTETFAPTNNETTVMEIPFNTHFEEMPEAIFWKIYIPKAKEEWQRNLFGSALFADGNLIVKSGDDFAEVWVTDFANGAPVTNASVSFFERDNSLFAQGKTDENGFLRVQKPLNISSFFAEAQSDNFVAFSRSDWTDGISFWDFGISANFWSTFRARALVFSDRPIYRPGDTVHFKGIFRGIDLNLLENPSIKITIQDSEWEEIFSQEFIPDEWGTVDFDLETKPEFATGNYSVSVFWNDDRITQSSFWIEEYKPASFRVEVQPERENFTDGTDFSATVATNYFFGMPVANAEVTWNAVATPLYFDKFSGEGWFSFGTGQCFWFCDTSEEVLASGTGTTDENGNLTISFPIEIEDNKLLTLRATAKNENAEFVSGFATIPLFVGDFVVGIRSENSWLDESDEKLMVIGVASAPDGTPLADKKLDFVLQKVSWNSIQKKGIDGEYYWESEKEAREIASTSATTKIGGKAEVEFDLPKDNPDFFGEMEVLVRSSENKKITASDSIWRSSRNYAPSFAENNNDRIDLRFDKQEYTPGEIAKLIPEVSFFEKKWAMLTLERETILSRKIFEWDGSAIEIPITDAMIPNVFVNFAVISGKGNIGDHFSELTEFQDLLAEQKTQEQEIAALDKKIEDIQKTIETAEESTAEILQKGLANTEAEKEKLKKTQEEITQKEVSLRAALSEIFGDKIPTVGTVPPHPEMKMGVKSIAVSAESRRLDIEIKTEKEEYLPGETVKFEISAKKIGGFPAENADISLAVVDESVLALKSRENEDIFEIFFAPHELAVKTAALLTKFSHRLNVRSAEGAKGGGGGLNLELLQKKRGEFRDTAFWTAHLTTDASGLAHGEFTLPDNITSWQMWSTANTKDSFFGSQKENFMSRKPLMIRPILPRFLVVDDRAEIGFSLHNNSLEDLIVQTDFSAQNVDVSGKTESNVSIKKGEEKTIFYEITALGNQESALGELASAQFSISATGDIPTAIDSAEFEIPILLPIIKSSLATSGFLTENDNRISEKILFPGGTLENLGGMFFSVAPNGIGNITNGLAALARYPYGCSEQIMSSHLPNIAILHIATESPDFFPDLDTEEMRKKIEDGITKILPLQREDGGFGFWANSNESYPYLTAYILLGLSETKDLGFAIPEEVLKSGERYLFEVLNNTYTNDLINGNTRAFALFVLSQINSQRSDSLFMELFSQRKDLSAEGLAFLLRTAHYLEKTDEEKTIRNELIALANIEARSAFFAGDDFAWNFSSDIRATSIALTALLESSPDTPILPQMIAYLRDQKRGSESWGGPWGTTQNTAWVLFALMEWVSAHPASETGVSAALNLQEIFSEDFAKNEFDPKQIFVPRSEMRLQNDLDIEKKGGVISYEILENAYYPVENFMEKNAGFYIVSNFFDRTDTKEENPVSSATKGDLLRGSVTVMTDRDRNFVGVEIPLPAGLEGVNFALETEDASLQKEIQKCEWYWCDTGSWRFSHTEFRDDRVFLFADFLPAGTYEFRFFARATTEGDFSWRPSRAEEIYHPEIFGNTAGRRFLVK